MRTGSRCAMYVALSSAIACSSPGQYVPEGFREKAVITGAGFLSRSVFYDHRGAEDPKMGYIETIQENQGATTGIGQLAVFDQENLWFVDTETRTAESILRYKDAGYVGRPLLVDIDGDGGREIACRGGGFSAVGLLDGAGKLLWKRGGDYRTEPMESTANSMAVGDLDRDGTLEFYIAAYGGLYSLAANGSENWRVGTPDDTYWHVELIDSEVASEREIVAIVHRRDRYQPYYLEFRDHLGRLVKRIEPARTPSAFRVLIWPGDVAAWRILVRSDSALTVMDTDGHLIWEYKIPGRFPSGHAVEATFVRFFDEKEPFLAVLLGTRAGYRRSVLSLFSLDGVLVYQEILGATRGLLATKLHGRDAPGEVLLVGDGIGKVVAYQGSHAHDRD